MWKIIIDLIIGFILGFVWGFGVRGMFIDYVLKLEDKIVKRLNESRD